jgi:hypothetical protein
MATLFVYNGRLTYFQILAAGIYLLLELHYQLFLGAASVSSCLLMHKCWNMKRVTSSQRLSLQVVSQAIHETKSRDHVVENK